MKQIVEKRDQYFFVGKNSAKNLYKEINKH